MLSRKNPSLPFFQQYYTLKHQEKWINIIKLGNQALSSDVEFDNIYKPLVLNRLASCYFYLGQYQSAIINAEAAFDIAKILQNTEQQARSAYLTSAAHRALGNKEQAMHHINIALKFVEHEIPNFIKAKIYFNAGALEQDLCRNPAEASQHYSVAMNYFQKNSDDHARTSIRNIRCLLEIGKINVAKLESERLSIEPNTKTYVHLLQLKSKIDMQQERYSSAYGYASQALEMAKDKGMSKDAERLESLIKLICEKDESILLSTHINAKQVPSTYLKFI